MAWYRSGTVTTANGSPTVAGAGTDFVSNTTVGEVFLGPDGRVYEIAQVVSATQLTILPIYQGASAGGQAYGIQPTQSFVRDLALNAATLLNTFGAVRDGIGLGLISDGSPAAPGIRFAADQDTGLRRHVGNGLSLVSGGVDRLTVDTGGAAITGSMQVAATEFPNLIIVRNGYNAWFLGGSGAASDNDFTIRLGPTTPAVRINPSGDLLVGASSGSSHIIQNDRASNGAPILQIRQAGGVTTVAAAFAVDYNGIDGANPANAAFKLGRSSTGRSLSASGTLNASGADYAEYVTKAAGCGTVMAGDVCGVDRDGHLTRTWADAISFVVKSTDPAYVGGDSWAAHLPARPDAPGVEPSPPIAPDAPPEIEDEAALAAWRGAAAAYSEQMAAYPAARATWQAATDAYARDLATWEAALEAERVKVDRIAFCGQVPVNVTGDFAVGDYLIAAAAGAGIKAVAVAEADITFEQYRRRLGKVWAVRDGRAWVDVQHG